MLLVIFYIYILILKSIVIYIVINKQFIIVGNLKDMTNKMQLCRTIYYSIVPCLLNMLQAILSLIIRSY